jgi:hypothetical protein
MTKLTKAARIAELEIALVKAAACLAAVAANIRAQPGAIVIEMAPTHSLAFCGERDARAALAAGRAILSSEDGDEPRT